MRAGTDAWRARSRRDGQREPSREAPERREREQEREQSAADQRQRRCEITQRARFELGDVDRHDGALAHATSVQADACRTRARRRNEIGDVADAYTRELLDDVAGREPHFRCSSLRFQLLDT